MSFWNKFTDWLGFEWVRARDEKGRYVADDKSTPNIDESKKKVYKSRTKKKTARITAGTKEKKKELVKQCKSIFKTHKSYFKLIVVIGFYFFGIYIYVNIL